MYRKSIFQEARELNEMISNACGDENVLRLAYKRRGSDHPVTWADTPDFAKLLSRILRRLELAEKGVFEVCRENRRRKCAALEWRNYPEEKPEQGGGMYLVKSSNLRHAVVWQWEGPDMHSWQKFVTHFAEIRLPEEETDEST